MQLPAGSDVPAGCSATPLASGGEVVECEELDPFPGYVLFAGEVFELDLSKSLGWENSDWWDTTIAFNEDSIVCHGPIECPDSFSTIERDYGKGRLSYQTFAMDDDSEWSFALDPAGGSFDGSAFGFIVSGSWEYGVFNGLNPFGGDVYVSGSAVLVHAPSLVPLPAAGWMLLTALGFVVGVSKRRRTGLHKSGER